MTSVMSEPLYCGVATRPAAKPVTFTVAKDPILEAYVSTLKLLPTVGV